MSRELPDELLSAYLDGELTAAEHKQVEQRLATSEADRQLLAELRSLRGDVAALPRVHVDSSFADRVVRAAVAAQIADVPPPLEVSARPRRSSARWIYSAAMLAAAASLLIAIQPWRSSPSRNADNPIVTASPVTVSPAQQLIDTLRSAAPGEGQALVVRLQVPAAAAGALDAALAQAGIAAADMTGGPSVGDAYRRQVSERLAVSSTAAASAVLVEAPLAELERALTAVADTAQTGVSLFPEARLNWTAIAESWKGLGESGSQLVQSPQSRSARLDAAQFPLGAAVAPVAALPAAPVGAGPVRVIILVEPIDAR